MTNIVVPQLGESVVEARIVKWLKKQGDRVQVGEPLVELETEKIDVEVGAERAGVLASIKRKEGEDVKVGDVLAEVDESSSATQGLPSAPQSSAAQTKASTQHEEPSPAPTDSPRSTPAAREIARRHEVDLTDIRGSGSAGRVMKGDVQATLGSADERSAPHEPREPVAADARIEKRVRMSKRRLTIARRLVEAQRTAAMLTTFNEVDMTAVMGIRERHQEAFKKQFGFGLGLTSFFVKAAVAALRAFPELNAEIQGEDVVLKEYYDVGIAVGAEGGLVVPVLRNADRLSFGDIEKRIRDLAARASEGSLTLDDLKGGTFTITNGGVFGSLLSTPILNPPQVGILGLHKVADRPVAIGGQVVIRPMMYVALSYDHRLIDGREAVQFLVKVREYVEDPSYLLLEG